MYELPIALRLRGRLCLVVGGGEVALRKAGMLSRAGARLRVVAPVCDPAVTELPEAEFRMASYRKEDLTSVVLVVAATGDRAVNRAVSADAQTAGIPVNVVDDPGLCTFVMPAIVDRGALWVAVGTGGAAPTLARMVRGQVERILPHGLGALVALLQQKRAVMQEHFPDIGQRRAFIESLLDGTVAEQACAGDDAGAAAAFDEALARFSTYGGEITLVGVGPGDPELLTLKAHRALLCADWVSYSPEVPRSVVELSRRDARSIAWPAPELPETLSRALVHALEQRERIVVLFPGPTPDPTGELGVALAKANVRTHNIPGVALPT